MEAVPTIGRARWLLRLFALAALLGLSSLVALVLSVQSSWGRRQVATTVGTFVSGLLRGGIRVGELLEISPSRLVLRDVEVTDPNGVRVIHADTLSASIDLRALLRGELVLDDVELFGAELSLREQNGELSVVSSFQLESPSVDSDDSKGSMSVLVRRGRLHAGRVSDLPGELAIRDFGASFSLSYRDQFSMRAQSVHARVSAKDAAAELSGGSVLLSMLEGERSTADLTLVTGEERVLAHASARWSRGAFRDLEASVRGELGAAWLSLAGQPQLGAVLRGRVRVDVTGHLDEIGGRSVLRAALDSAGGSLSLDGRCTPHSCELHARSAGLSVAEIVVMSPLDPVSFDFDLSLAGDALQNLSLVVREARLGALSVPAFSTHGVWSKERLKLHALELPALGIVPNPFVLELHSKHSGQVDVALSLALARFDGTAIGGPAAGLRARLLRVQAQASYRSSERALSSSATLSVAELQRGTAVLEQLELSAQAEGRLEQPRLSLSATALRLQLGELPLVNLDLSANGTPTNFELSAQLMHGTTFADGSFTVQRRGRGTNLAGSARISGWAAAPLELTLADSRIDSDGIALAGLEAKLGDASVTLFGHYSLRRESALELRAKRVCAEPLAPLLGESAAWLLRVRGCAEAELSFAGTTHAPQLVGSLLVPDLTFDGYPLGRAELGVELSSKRAVGHASEEPTREAVMNLALSGSLLELRAQLAAKPAELSMAALAHAPFRAKLHADAQLVELAPLLKVDPELVRGLAVSLDLDSDGTNAHGALALSRAGEALLRATANAQHTPDGLQTSRPIRNVDVDLSLDQLPLRLLDKAPTLSTAKLDGTVQLRGLLGAEPRAKLAMKVSDLSASGLTLSPIALSGRADSRAADLTVQADADSRSMLRASAHLPWRWEAPTRVVFDRSGIEGRARLNAVPFALLLTAVPALGEARGSVTGELSLKGLDERADLSGKLELKEGAFTVQEPFMRVDRLELELELADEVMRLRDLKLVDQAGELTGSGELRYTGLEPVKAELNLVARELPLRREGITVAVVSTHIGFKAQLQQRPRQLYVRLREVDIGLPAAESNTLQSLDQHSDVAYVDQPVSSVGADRSQAEPAVPMDIELDADEPFWVRRPALSVELSAKLRFHHDGQETTLRGVVQIRRGLLTLLGKGFELRRGSMTFVGGKVVDPSIVLDAVHKLGDGQTVTATIRGTLSAPTLSFSSSVPGVTTDAQAMQLLVSGRDSTAAESATAQVGSALAAMTTGMFSKVTGGQLGKYLPVLALESGASSGTRMRAGVQADDLIPAALRGIVQAAYVEGFVGTKNQGSSRTSAGGVLMELYFPRHLVTGGTWELPNNWAVEVTWEP